MLINLFFILISLSTFASELLFPPLKDWDLKKDLFGARYVLIHEASGEADQVVLFKTIAKPVKKSRVEAELELIIRSKEVTKSNSWSDVKIQKPEDLNWGEEFSGRIVEVSFTQLKIPHTALVGIYPGEKDYMLIFYSTEVLKAGSVPKKLFRYLQSVRVTKKSH